MLNKKLLFLLFTIKILAGWYVVNSYGERYNDQKEADIYKFYYDGVALKQIFEEDKTLFFDLFFKGEPFAKPEVGSSFYKLENWAEMESGYRDYMSYQTNYTFFNPQRTMIRICALLSFFNTSIFFQSAFFSILGGIGLFLFIKAFFDTPNKQVNFFLILLFILPTFLIWTSSILKESVVIFSIGLFSYGLFKLYQSKFRLDIWYLLSLLGALTLILTSVHHFLSFIVAIVIGICLKFVFLQNKLVRNLMVFGVLIVGILGFVVISPKLISKYNHEYKIGRGGVYITSEDNDKTFFIDYTDYETLKKEVVEQTDSKKVIMFSEGVRAYELNEGVITDKLIRIPDHNYELKLKYVPANTFLNTLPYPSNYLGIVGHFPFAFRNVFLAPLFASEVEVNGVWFLLILENIFVLILVVGSIYFFVRNFKSFSPNLRIIIFSLMIYALAQFILIGYTTPILGNIVRYKTGMVISLIVTGLLLLENGSLGRCMQRPN